MAVSGFEGFEKRLELRFSGDDPSKIGLRRLDFPSLEKVLHEVQCTVVSAVGNRHFDAYVLSESSLFVYPYKIVIKTCGTTQLLKSLRPLAASASAMGLSLSGCRYTRGSFIFPQAQPYPHTSFADEVGFLEENLPGNLTVKKAKVMESSSDYSCYKWHVFTASCEGGHVAADDDLYTIEICMTELDRVSAEKFYRRINDGGNGDSAGKEMTEVSGIRDINKNAFICDYAFDPCGYSMNGVDGERYSTVHVTPEDGFSYASYECVGPVFEGREALCGVLRKVVEIFRPGVLSVSLSRSGNSSAGDGGGGDEWVRGAAEAVGPLGMRLRSCVADEFPAAGDVIFQTFTRS